MIKHISYSHTVTELFEQQVFVAPQHIAIADENRTFTYQQLNQQANQLADRIQQQGVKKNNFVALLLEPSIEFIICVLAILKAGAIYLPLDSLSPPPRLQEILMDATPTLLIVDEQSAPKIKPGQWLTVCLSDLSSPLDHLPIGNFPCIQSPIDPLYIVYTSGSTGKPKGVLVPHQAVVNLVKTVNYFNVSDSDVVAQFINLAFDPSALEIWSALLNGATLFIMPFKASQDDRLIAETISKHHITHLILPTRFFHQLAHRSPQTLNLIHTLVFGGEAVNSERVSHFLKFRREHNLPITLVNAYGPTEATVATCRQVMDEKMENDIERLSSIGKPIPHVKMYILDGHNQPVCPGEVGELCISGVNLALGYYHDENSNREKFIENPFDDCDPFKRLYKTGDLVKERPDGHLLYIGRTDDTVKIHGFRVHLSEIERHLLTYPGVTDASVVAEKDSIHHTRLIAYLVTAPELRITSDDLRKYLSQYLPPYMWPTKYVRIVSLPLTTVGKIDKKRLSAIPGIDLAVTRITPPMNSVEQKLKAIFCQLLHTDALDVTKNFFELGLDSVLLMEACVHIEQAFQRMCRPKTLLTYPTIRKLGQYLQQQLTAAPKEVVS